MVLDRSRSPRSHRHPARTLLAAVLASVLLAVGGCGGASVTGAPVAPAPTIDRHARTEPAESVMPPAPVTRTAWLRAVSTALATGADGQSAARWLAQRRTRSGATAHLAVVFGVDDVIVQTHYAGLSTLVPQTAAVVRTALRLGYTVRYITGRSAGPGLRRVQATLASAGLLGAGVCAHPARIASQEAGKAACRAALVRTGDAVVMSVAASELSFDGAYPAEVDVALPDFGVAPVGVS